MSEGNTVLYVRSDKGSESDQDHVWDDTLLIRAYDKAVNSAKEKLMKSLAAENDESNVDSSSVIEEGGNSPKRKKKHDSKKKTWKVGNSCRAVYSMDGEEYEAEIIKLLPNLKSCIIRFYGYGNEDQVPLDNLLPSLGKGEIELQKQHAQEETGEWCVGDLCRATFSGDGQEYEAEIVKIYSGKNLVLIRYLGYGNQEKVPLDDLSPSLGPKEVELQIVKAHTEYAARIDPRRMATNPVTSKPNFIRGPYNGYISPSRVMPPPPPPTNSHTDTTGMDSSSHTPPFPGIPQGAAPLPLVTPPSIDMMMHAPHTETEALTAMLMSWYMSGYHTGYYQGLRHAQTMNSPGNTPERKTTSSPGKTRIPSSRHHKHH